MSNGQCDAQPPTDIITTTHDFALGLRGAFESEFPTMIYEWLDYAWIDDQLVIWRYPK